MGDRGNVLFTDENGTFGFYTHWNGSSLPETVAEILADNPGVVSRLDGDLAYGYRGVLHGLLERARQYDIDNNEPDCELQEKKQRILDFAEELGVEIDFL